AMKAKNPSAQVWTKIAEIEEGARGDLTTLAAETKSMKVAEKLALNSIKPFGDDPEVAAEWKEAQKELVAARPFLGKLAATITAVKKQVDTLKAANNR